MSLNDFDQILAKRDRRNQFNAAKADALVDARERKGQAIVDSIARVGEEIGVDRNAESWVSQLDWHPNSIPGQAVNLAARAVSGTARLVSNAVTAPDDLAALASERGISQQALDAYNRSAQGESTPEEVAEVARPGSQLGADFRVLEAARKMRERSTKIAGALDLSGSVHTGRTDALESQLREQGQDGVNQTKAAFNAIRDGQQSLWTSVPNLLSGAGKLGFTALNAALDNPGAVFEHLVENAPQLLVGGVGGAAGKAVLATSNVGYGAEAYRKGVTEFQKANGGQLPSAEQLTHMGNMGMLAAAAEHAGDAVSLAGMKGLTKAGKEVAKAAEEASRTSFKKALLNTAVATGKSTAAEAGTESFQTYAENEAQLKETAASDLYVSGAIGGMVGGTMTSGPRAVSELAGLQAQAKQDMKERRINGYTREQADLKSSSYSPQTVLSSLYSAAAKKESTLESRQESYNKGGELIMAHESQVEKLSARTPAGRESLEQMRASIQEDIKTLQASKSPEAKEELKSLTEEVKRLDGLLAQPVAEGKELAAIVKRRNLLESMTPKLYEALDKIEAEVSRKDVQQEAPVAEAKSTELATIKGEPEVLDPLPQKLLESPKKAEKGEVVLDIEDAKVVVSESSAPEAIEKTRSAARRLLVRAMAAPDELSADDALAIANNQSNGLSGAERAFLKTLSESQAARNALKSLDDVSSEVLYGDVRKNQVGIETIRSRVFSALKSGNVSLADRSLGMLDKFAKAHGAKYTALSAALAQAKKTGELVQVARMKDGTWKTLDFSVSRDELKRHQGQEIHKNSGGLVNKIGMEVEALEAARKELKAAKAAHLQKGAAVEAPAPAPAPKPEKKEEKKPEPKATGEAAAKSEEAKPAPTRQAAEPVVAEKKKEEPKAEKAEEAVDELASVFPEEPQEAAKEEAAPAQEEAEGAITLKQIQEAPDAGRLIALDSPKAGPNGEALSYQEGNLLGRNFSQNPQGKNEGTYRPLVAVKDFLTRLRQGHISAEPFVGSRKHSDAETNSNKLKALEAFLGKAEAWAQHFNSNLMVRKGKEAFFFQDMVQFLNQVTVDPQGREKVELEENVLTAMSFALWSYLAEQGSRARWNSEEEINQILRRAPDHPVSDAELLALRDVGVRGSTLYNSLGKRVTGALGLKLKKNAPQGDLARLEAAIGAHIVKMATDEKSPIKGHVPFMERTEIGADVWAEMGVDTQGDYSKDVFFKVVRDEKGKLASHVQEIVDATKGTQGFLNDLFSVESGVLAPTFEPKEFTQKMAKNSPFKVPQYLQKILNHSQKQGSKVRQDYWHLFNAADASGNQLFSMEMLMKMAGSVEVDNWTLGMNADIAEAKNDQLARGITNFMEFVQESVETRKEGLDAAMYFEHEVWKQQRVGIKTNLINPQANKFQRAMLTRDDWETEVSSESPEQLDNLRLRIMEGLGVKTDRMTNEQALADYQALLDPRVAKGEKAIQRAATIQAGVRALMGMLAGDTLTPEQAQAVVAAVDAGGEKMHSLDSLMAIAQWGNSRKNSGGKPFKFKVNIVAEVDGVTNGPMLSQIFFGAEDSAGALMGKLARGGFFPEGNAIKNFNVWKSGEGNNDLYEGTIGHALTTGKKALIASEKTPKKRAELEEKIERGIKAIQMLTGSLMENGKVTKAGRNIIKTPLTAFNFGSSPFKAVDSMADAFIEKALAKIEEAARTNDGDISSVTEVLNALVGTSVFRRAMTFDDFIKAGGDRGFPEGIEEQIKKAFMNSLGAVVRQTLDTEFKVFSARRNAMNRAAGLAHSLYSAVYKSARAEYIQNLVKAGKLAAGKKGSAYHDLSAEQEAGLRSYTQGLMPVVASPMSLRDGDTSAGLPVTKEGRGVSDWDTYANTTNFGRPTAWGNASILARGEQATMEAPGKAMPPLTTHSADSNISHMAVLVGNVLNVHDAHIAGAGKTLEVAKNLNQATWDTLISYSPLGEMVNGLERSIQALASMTEKRRLPKGADAAFWQELEPTLKEIAKEVLNQDATFQYFPKAKKAEAIRKELEKDTYKDPFGLILGELRKQAKEADTVRLGVLSEMGHIDQYAGEGGQYDVTAEQRAQAKRMLEQVPAKYASDPKTEAAVVKVLSLVSGAYIEKNAPAFTEAFAAEQAGKIEDVRKKTEEELEDEYWADKEAPQPEDRTQSRPAAVEILQEVATASGVSAELRQEAEKAMDHLIQSQDYDTDVALQIAGVSTEAQMALFNAKDLVGVPSWAEVGTPKKKSEQWIIDLFSKEKTLPASQVIASMLEYLASKPNSNWKRAQAMLLRQLSTTLPKSLTFTYITPETAWDKLGSLPASASHGWFQPHPDRLGEGGIYLMGAEFKKSHLDFQLLMHEMVHAATLDALQSEDPAVQERVEDLEQILAAAQAYIAKDPKKAKQFEYATSNLDELVAYGMTNQRFQADVLDKISIRPSQRVKSPLRKTMAGMEAFVKTLTNLLFGNKPMEEKERDMATNGLSVLIRSVSEVMAAEAKQPTRAQRVVRAMLAEDSDLDPITKLDSAYEVWGKLAQRDVGSEEAESGKRRALQSVLALGSRYLAEGERIRNQNRVMSGLDAWTKALATGEAAFASEVAAAPFATSDSDLFAIQHVQLVVQAMLDMPEASVVPQVRELRRLYQEARATLKSSDFASQEQYDFLFKFPPSEAGRNEYLSRFVAMGVAHTEIASKLEFITRLAERNPLRKETLLARLQHAFEKAMNWLHDRMAGVSANQTSRDRLERLVEQMADLQNRTKSKIANERSASKFVESADAISGFIEAARAKGLEIAKSEKIRNHASGYVRGASGLVRIVVGERGDLLLDQMQQMRDKVMQERAGWVTGLLNEVQGIPATVQALIRMAKHSEQERKRYIEDVAAAARDAFVDHTHDDSLMGAEDGHFSKATRSQAHQAALTKVFLKTGAHILLDDRSMPEIRSLVEDPKALQAAIKAELGKLSQHRELVHYYVRQAKALGYFKATGRVRSPMLMMNAGNIAQLFGTGREHGLQAGELAKVTKVIDTLATLYALEHTDAGSMTLAQELLASEDAREDGKHGVEITLRLHRMLEQESRERLFENSEALAIKGFTSDIFNPHTALEVAYTPEEAQALKEMGYTTADHLEVARDQDDPDTARGQIYVLRDGGLLPRVTGAITLTGMKAKGSQRTVNTSVAGVEAPGFQDVGRHAEITRRRQSQVDDLFRGRPGWDPSKEANRMAPVLNAQGEVVSWRYLMEDRNKESLLEQDLRFDQVLGAMAGSVLDKAVAAEQNNEVLAALKDIYDLDYADRPESFVDIGPRSTDPELRELYRLLPESTKAEIERLWGKGRPMQVPYALVHPVFGYRKWSMANPFEKAHRNRQADLRGDVRSGDDSLNAIEEVLVKLVENTLRIVAQAKGMDEDAAETYSRRGAVVIRRAESVWQALVGIVKDTIVVKSVAVLWGNIRDNMAMLVLRGVSPKDLLRNQMIAIQGALAFKRDRAELAQLEIQRRTGTFPGDEKELEARIVMLEDSIARNPVKELIDAGLMPTIAEDVNLDDNIYSYKSRFERGVESATDKVHPLAKTGAKWFLMAHDTTAYQLLSNTTQISDFVARYVLYKHVTERTENPMTKAEAIREVEEVFVNYDTPQHPGLQYLNDHGFMNFTKYFLRIQRVLARLTRDRPLSVLTATLLDKFLGGVPSPMQSSIVYRFGNNPFSGGALELPGVVDDLATAKAMSMIF